MDDYQASIEHWRARRIARLTAPEGWLSLTGLHWLEPGRNTLGSAGDNAIVLTKAPARLGVVEWHADETLVLQLAPGSDVLVDGRAQSQVTLRDDREPDPTRVSFGSVNFVVIDRGGRKALRVRDSKAETRTRFAGIESFPVDPSWRIVADWVPFDPPQVLETANVIGQMERYPVPGRAVFERDGRTHELLPVIEVPGDEQLFLIFADGTSGRETYGAARFLYADPPRDGRIVLDFNKAYNPPCAFTAFATCPLAPPENRLDLRVTAGEKKYRNGH
ncbi:MAG TPA: DUF1684 domain-containing protein [Rhodanobacteraceae bacterium]|jgi:uncharacterized protein (DUF1684 family)|nr:DUF1684 domain-containing protein [Rhodanobacteraceae bacterium]